MTIDILTQAFDSSFSHHIAGVHTSFPGQVEKVHNKSKIDVQPMVSKKYKDGTVQQMPIITNVPVVWPRAGKASMTFPLQKGDGVLIHCCERSIDNWLSSGNISEPGNTRKFSISDAIAIPGCISFTDDNYAASETDVEITFDSQKIVIKANGDIEIGTSSLKKLITEEFRDLFNNHVHNFTAAPSGVFSTSVPALVVGTTPEVPPVAGGVVAAFNGSMPTSHLTDKVSAE